MGSSFSPSSRFSDRPTRALVDRGALAHNFALARRAAGARAVIAVVKADAYGHGAVEVARRLAREGCTRFAVATVAEAAALRGAGVDAQILLLGGVHGLAEARSALALETTPVLHHEGQRVWIEAAAAERGRRALVHVEVDTGMHRLGVPADDAVALAERVAASPRLALEGVSTHFACADDPDPAPTRAQAAAFARVLEALRKRGIDPGLVHLANSAGLLGAPAWDDVVMGTAVRPGILLYGVSPAPQHDGAGLRPVMTVETEIATVRPVREGEGVGYGATWRAPRSGWIATLPMGYADGIPWSVAHGGGAEVLIAGRRRPIVGRISMDLVTVWVEDGAVEIGERAVLFGASADVRLGVESLAAAAGTLPYEILVRIGARVPRVFVG